MTDRFYNALCLNSDVSEGDLSVNVYTASDTGIAIVSAFISVNPETDPTSTVQVTITGTGGTSVLSPVVPTTPSGTVAFMGPIQVSAGLNVILNTTVTGTDGTYQIAVQVN
jgi:hypothetical protein